MVPFFSVEGIPFPIYQACQYGCATGEAKAHLRRKHKELSVAQRQRIQQALDAYPTLLKSRDKVTAWTAPRGMQSFAALGTPV